MPVHDMRAIEIPGRDDIQGDVQPDVREAPRPAAVDAVRWAATLMAQLGLDPQARTPKRAA